MPGTQALLAERRSLLGDPRLRGRALARAHADLVDRWLGELLGDQDGVAVVAVGGYGRRQLCPASDLDVVLVHRGRRDVARLAESLWYPIWDAHLALDHSVRTVREALAVAGDDLKVALGLLDARFVAGEADLAGDLVARVHQQWRRQAKRWLPVLDEACQERHRREGEVAFLLEPDLKAGRGGLRDLGALRAAGLGAPILPDPGADLDRAEATLVTARVELHRQAGRPLDRLLLQEQDGVAGALDLPDSDALMAQVAEAARAVTWAGDDAWRRIRSWLAGPRGRHLAPDRALGPGLALRDGEVAVRGEGPADPTLALRAADAAAARGTRLGREALAALAARPSWPAGPWPDEARRALVSTLGAGRPAIDVLEDLDQAGLLVRLFPEWSRVRNHPQRNAYHRFTVDRHLLEAAAEAASLVRRVHRPDLLLLGALFHDLGKGSPGDHSVVGAALVGDVGPRLGLPPDDVTRLATLVGHHLLLADTATRRDPADPATIRLVASTVGDRETLDLLAALTEADAAATGPWAWTPWKRALVADLVRRTERVLEGEHPEEPPPFPLPRHRGLVTRAASGLVVVAEGDRLTVAAPDRPGLLSLVAGVLALEGLEVVAADVWSGEGVAVSEYTVTPELGGTPDWDRLAARLREVAAAPGTLGPALAARARSYARRRRVPTPGPRVRVDLGASTRATVVEVWAADEVGLLHRLAGVFAGLGLDIRHAKVQTLGHEVVDTFYLVDDQGRRVTAPGALATLERAVVDTLGGEPPDRLAEREPDPAP